MRVKSVRYVAIVDTDALGAIVKVAVCDNDQIMLETIRDTKALPEFVLERVACLRMCERNKLVDTIGRPTGDNCVILYLTRGEYKLLRNLAIEESIGRS